MALPEANQGNLLRAAAAAHAGEEAEAAVPPTEEDVVAEAGGKDEAEDARPTAANISRLKEPEEMTLLERSEHALKCREVGNAAFAKADWAYAVFAYEEGIRYLAFMPNNNSVPLPDFDHGGDDRIKSDCKLTVMLMSNCAAAYLKADSPRRALRHCNQALVFEADNVKALFRRAQAQIALSDHDAALRDVAKLLELQPGNSAAERLRWEAQAGIRKAMLREKAVCAKMFE